MGNITDNYIIPKFTVLTEEQKQLYIRKAIDKILIEETEKRILVSKYIIEEELDKFLSQFHSSITKKIYTTYIYKFLDYTKKHKIHPFIITNKEIEEYKFSLSSLSTNSQRLILNSIKSFYTYLNRISNGEIRKPQFLLPKKYTTSTHNKLELPLPVLKQNIDTFLNSIKSDSIRTILTILAETGLRIGGIPNLHFTNTKFTTISKGKLYKGTITEALKTLIEQTFNKPIEEIDFSNTNTNYIKVFSNKHSKSLLNKGKIQFPISCHDLRRYKAITDYNLHKDILHTKKILNHSSITTTEVYLKSYIGN